MNEPGKIAAEQSAEEKPFFQVIIHSFFVIPFLIIVFGLILFTAVNLLTREQRSVYDYLEDVKTGGLSKRWQGAFELSRILANPKLIPSDERFVNELGKAFQEAKHDDSRVRQYLVLAMARTGNKEFVKPILEELETEKEENIPAFLYALGMLKSDLAVDKIHQYVDHPKALIRSMAVVALGNIKDPRSTFFLQGALHDSEPNVQWGAALSLTQIGDASGKEILLQLLDRSYLSKFSEVDPDEQDNLMLKAVEASVKINDPALNQKINELSQHDQNMKIRSSATKAMKK